MKKKRNIVAIIIIILITIIGVTFAYFQSNVSFENAFNIGIYKLVTTEVFESPDRWNPGDEVPKRITTKNEGTIPAAVRVKFEEKWLDEDGNDITDQATENSVIFNYEDTRKWVKEGEYFYYKYILEPGEKTTSFLKSVTLNPALGETNDIECETVDDEDGTTKICESVNPAFGGKYQLIITKETVQADKYKEVWDTNIDLSDKKPWITEIYIQNEGQLTPGDIVGIGDTEDFYVISNDGEKTVLLAKYNLLVANQTHDGGSNFTPIDSNSPGYGLQSEDTISYTYDSPEWKGMTTFSSTDYWDDGNGNIISPYNANGASNDGNPYPYVYDENSDVYKYISGPDGYISKLIEMGAPSSTTGRLLSYEEALDAQQLKKDGKKILASEQNWWLGSSINDEIFNVDAEGNIDYTYYDNYVYYGVRPVIEVYNDEIF